MHDNDVCLGKIVGGFDALQRLMHVETTSPSGPCRLFGIPCCNHGPFCGYREAFKIRIS